MDRCTHVYNSHSFDVLSGGVSLSHVFGEEQDWVLERPQGISGTAVLMKLANSATRTAKEIFDQYSSGSDYGFTRTVVPVRLARYGEDRLISRSQAKAVLARLDRFKTVVFNFAGVDMIGQAFADQIFRVFARSHLEIELRWTNASVEISRMIERVQAEL